MSEALLVIGKEYRFPGYEHRYTMVHSRMRHFLAKKGLGPVHTLSPNNAYDSDDALRSIRDFLERDTHQQPALIVYTGHGDENRWSLDKGLDIPYAALLRELLSSPVPVILINACCNAGAFIERALAVRPSCFEQLLIMAACAGDKLSYGGFVERVISDWHAGRPFIPRERHVEVIRLGNPEMEALGIPMSEVLEDGVIRINWCPSKPVKIGEYTEPPDELRWGASLDHHLFAQKA